MERMSWPEMNHNQTEEVYNYRSDPRDVGAQVVLTVDESSYTGKSGYTAVNGSLVAHQRPPTCCNHISQARAARQVTMTKASLTPSHGTLPTLSALNPRPTELLEQVDRSTPRWDT